MASLKEYLCPTDQLLIDQYLKDPKGFQKVRQLLGETNAGKETHTQVSEERTEKAQPVLRDGLHSTRL